MVRQARIAGIRPEVAATSPPLQVGEGDDQSDYEPTALLTPEELAEHGF